MQIKIFSPFCISPQAHVFLLLIQIYLPRFEDVRMSLTKSTSTRVPTGTERLGEAFTFVDLTCDVPVRRILRGTDKRK